MFLRHVKIDNARTPQFTLMKNFDAAYTPIKVTGRLTAAQERRILKNKADLAAGKGRRFSSIKQYIKSLEEDN